MSLIRNINIIITAALAAFFILVCSSQALAVSAPNASGRVDAFFGAHLRSKPTTSSSSVTLLTNNTALTITREVFTSRTSIARDTRWYYVTDGGRKGYIRSDLVDGIKYRSVSARTTDALNYRKGAGTLMTRKGTLDAGSSLKVCLAASAKGSDAGWYRVIINGSSYYVTAGYIKLGIYGSGSGASTGGGSGAGSDSPSTIAKAILANPTSGGTSCRIVYTLDDSNCSRKFAVSGLDAAATPQGFDYSNGTYTIVFGDKKHQAIVRYDSNGSRLSSAKFSFNMGHPNGITYNPKKELFYIFKGNQYKIYTYNRSTGRFGTTTTPYSSSGVGYDSVRGNIVASSRTGMRVYSADGKFTQSKHIYRCTHSGTHYVQDCCAYNGIILHGVSGSNKKTSNYIDIYRADDSKYLGTLKLTLGEIESLVVNDKGFLELLINTPSKDYIWTTELNVEELAGQS